MTKNKVETREIIKFTNKELNLFDFTNGSEGSTWELNSQIYRYVTTVEKIRVDILNPSWDIIVKRESDSKYFKWNYDPNTGDIEYGHNSMIEVFKKLKIIEQYV